jgi:DNA-binding MarR family transcriptional regulator
MERIGKYEILKDLISLLDEHSTLNNEIDLSTFSQFLYEKREVASQNLIFKDRSTESAIAQLLFNMNKYGKQYFKMFLEDAPIKNQEELIFLLILSHDGKMTKTELFQKAFTEKTTGMEMMKRLEKTKLIKSYENKMDKRSKIVEITENGIRFLDKMYPQLEQLSNVVCGNLNAIEKENLLDMLINLDSFHKPIYQNSLQKMFLTHEQS